jgi:SAM-dependent methyltransferase
MHLQEEWAMVKDYTLNSTKSYHIGGLKSLGWELTICNALQQEGTPLRKLLTCNESFGRLLYGCLCTFLPLWNVTHVLEVGGGYGYLMKDFLEKDSSLKACMLDISPFLLNKQRETLKGFSVEYREGDFLEVLPSDLSAFDLVIMNENLGDFPSLINIRTEVFDSKNANNDPVLKWVQGIFEKYGLERPEGKVFNLNMGAIEALEKLCCAKVPYIYIGEHSCEASVSGEMSWLFQIKSTGNPERITLAGHDEYTIKFSYLQKIASFHGYESIRGPFADFIPLTLTDEARFALMYGGHYSDEAEVMSQFVEDLYKYEYLILKEKEEPI